MEWMDCQFWLLYLCVDVLCYFVEVNVIFVEELCMEGVECFVVDKEFLMEMECGIELCVWCVLEGFFDVFGEFQSLFFVL